MDIIWFAEFHSTHKCSMLSPLSHAPSQMQNHLKGLLYGFQNFHSTYECINIYATGRNKNLSRVSEGSESVNLKFYMHAMLICMSRGP